MKKKIVFPALLLLGLVFSMNCVFAAPQHPQGSGHQGHMQPPPVHHSMHQPPMQHQHLRHIRHYSPYYSFYYPIDFGYSCSRCYQPCHHGNFGIHISI